MNEVMSADAYGVLKDPETLVIQRVLPGPVERVWAYLTDSDLRRQWLAAGQMEMKAGSAFEFVWRNDELSDRPAKRPDGFSEEHRMQSRIIEIDPPRKLSFTWQDSGDVTFELESRGSNVLLTVTHRRPPSRSALLGVSAGWHRHLDILAERMAGKAPEPYWDGWIRLRQDYERRFPE